MTADVVDFLAYRQARRDDKNVANVKLLMFPFRAMVAYAVLGATLYDIWRNGHDHPHGEF